MFWRLGMAEPKSSHERPGATEPKRLSTNARRACGSASGRARARSEGQQIGGRVAAIERPAALVLGLGFFETPGCIEIKLEVARDKHRPRLECHHLGHCSSMVSLRRPVEKSTLISGWARSKLKDPDSRICLATASDSDPFLGTQQIVAALA